MLRLDRAATPRTITLRLDRVVEGAAGSMIVDGVAARVGVLEYTDYDTGGERAEYVSPEVLFAPESVASLIAAPVTLGHPSQGVTPETWRRHAVGHVVKVKEDYDQGLLRVSVAIADATAQQAIRDGVRELSCGYSAGFDPQPGVTESGARFDGVQTSRTYNHLAIVDRARAGRAARLYLDGVTTMKITIKDKTYDAPAWVVDALGVAAKAERSDEIATGEVMINGTQMILPQAMIDQIMAMLGALTPEAPEVVEAPDAMPEGESDPEAAKPPESVVPPSEEKADARAKQVQRERVIADALRAGVLPVDYDVARHSTERIMSDVIALIDPTAASNKTTVDAAARGDAMSLGLIEGTFRAALRFRKDGVVTRRVDQPAAHLTVTHSIGEQLAQ
jgi:hypothetical protein